MDPTVRDIALATGRSAEVLKIRHEKHRVSKAHRLIYGMTQQGFELRDQTNGARSCAFGFRRDGKPRRVPLGTREFHLPRSGWSFCGFTATVIELTMSRTDHRCRLESRRKYAIIMDSDSSRTSTTWPSSSEAGHPKVRRTRSLNLPGQGEPVFPVAIPGPPWVDQTEPFEREHVGWRGQDFIAFPFSHGLVRHPHLVGQAVLCEPAEFSPVPEHLAERFFGLVHPSFP